jgi:hypothetical protein
MAKPACAAASESAKRPPSEKLSGVTLTIPATCGWSRRTTRSRSRSAAARRGQAVPGPLRFVAEPGERRLDPLDRNELGIEAAIAVHRHPLDRREPQHSPGQPGHLAVMAEGRVDEGGGPQIMAQGHENAASA